MEIHACEPSGPERFSVKAIRPRSRLWAAVIGVLACVAAAWMVASSPAPMKQLSPDMIQLCSVHRKLMLRSPRSKPATIYSILGLNPYAKPFYPPELASMNGNKQAITKLILKAYSETAGDTLQRLNSGRRDSQYYELQSQRYSYRAQREEGGPLSHTETDEEWSDILTQAASILLSSQLRDIYDHEFLPVITQSSFLKSEGSLSKKKRAKLGDICQWTETAKL